MEWCLIESDPGIFTELIRKFGVKGVQVEEVYDLDDATSGRFRDVHGLVFLFKWTQETEKKSALSIPDDGSGPFFAAQVIQNACGTQALLNILMNADNIELGDELTQFKAFAQEFDPETRGMCMSNSDILRNAHNSFALQNDFAFDIPKRKATKDDDVYHFVAYIPYQGRVYELDGLRKGPIDLGPIDGKNWVEVAKPAVQERMTRYATEEVRFALMAVVEDIKQRATEQLAELQKQLDQLSTADNSSVDAETLTAMSEEIQTAMREQAQIIENEEAKTARYQREHCRRRHNYIPFIVKFLQLMADKGTLMEAAQKSVKKPKTK